MPGTVAPHRGAAARAGPAGHHRSVRSALVPELSPHDSVNTFFREGAALIDLESELVAILTTPDRELAV